MEVNGGGAWLPRGKLQFCQLFNCSANLNPVARVNRAISFRARIGVQLCADSCNAPLF